MFCQPSFLIGCDVVTREFGAERKTACAQYFHMSLLGVFLFCFVLSERVTERTTAGTKFASTAET